MRSPVCTRLVRPLAKRGGPPPATESGAEAKRTVSKTSVILRVTEGSNSGFLSGSLRETVFSLGPDPHRSCSCFRRRLAAQCVDSDCKFVPSWPTASQRPWQPILPPYFVSRQFTTRLRLGCPYADPIAPFWGDSAATEHNRGVAPFVGGGAPGRFLPAALTRAAGARAISSRARGAEFPAATLTRPRPTHLC